METLRDFWGFLKVRKRFWLVPFLGVLILFGAFLILSEGAVVAPFIYALF